MPADIKPRHIDEHVWFYPTARGLEFMVEQLWNGHVVRGILFTLGPRQLAAAVKAVEAAKSSSKAKRK